MSGEIIQTQKGPRIRHGAVLVHPDVKDRILAEGRERLARLRQDPEYLARIQAAPRRRTTPETKQARREAMLKYNAELAADPVRLAAIREQQRVDMLLRMSDPERRDRVAAGMKAMLEDPDRGPRFREMKRAAMLRINADPAIKAKRAAAHALHRNVIVSTTLGSVRIRRRLADSFNQWRLAIGDEAALEKLIDPDWRRFLVDRADIEAAERQKKAQARAARLAARRHAVEEPARRALRKLARCAEVIFRIGRDVIISPTRRQDPAPLARRLIIAVLYDACGFSMCVIGAVLRRDRSSVGTALAKARSEIGSDDDIARKYRRLVTMAAVAAPQPDGRPADAA